MDTDLICWLSNHMQIISLGILINSCLNAYLKQRAGFTAPLPYWASITGDKQQNLLSNLKFSYIFVRRRFEMNTEKKMVSFKEETKVIEALKAIGEQQGIDLSGVLRQTVRARIQGEADSALEKYNKNR
jgi:hypothetical protein